MRWGKLLSVLLFFISLSSALESKTYTFEKLNILSDDLVLKGINPKYDFYLPTLPQLSNGEVRLNLSFSPYLRDDSTLTVLINDIPYKTFKVREIPPLLRIPFIRKGDRDFVKVSLLGNLRVSNNVCEDVFSDKVWLVVGKNSTVEFKYDHYKNIREFLRDYDNRYCIKSPWLIPLVYQICKQNPVPCDVIYQPNDEDCRKYIDEAKGDLLELKGNTLYVPLETALAFERGVFYPFLFGSPQEIKNVRRESEEVLSEVSLRDLGIDTVSVEGVGNLSYTIPLELSKIGGVPDKLFFRIFIAHTPVHKRDNMEIRIYLNGRMVSAYPLDGSGKKSFDIELPVNELTYGTNYVSVNLANFTSADNCFGAVSHIVFTLFGDSYFYWNNLKSNPKTISDFIKILNGYVAIVVKDPHFYNLATKLISDLANFNKNIKTLDLNPPDVSRYNFLILFESPANTKGRLIDLSRGEFDLINPLTQKVIFSSKPNESFTALMVDRIEGKPALVLSYYPDPSGIKMLSLYQFRNLLELSGNVGIATKDFISAYEVGKKLRVEYKYEKGFGYYWNRYKLWIIMFLVIPVTTFLAYVYRKLTRRSQT